MQNDPPPSAVRSILSTWPWLRRRRSADARSRICWSALSWSSAPTSAIASLTIRAPSGCDPASSDAPRLLPDRSRPSVHPPAPEATRALDARRPPTSAPRSSTLSAQASMAECSRSTRPSRSRCQRASAPAVRAVASTSSHPARRFPTPPGAASRPRRRALPRLCHRSGTARLHRSLPNATGAPSAPAPDPGTRAGASPRLDVPSATPWWSLPGRRTPRHGPRGVPAARARTT